MTNTSLFKTEGTIPVLSNSEKNNGIGGYVGLKAKEEGNIITFSDTSKGPETMFYQPMPFIGYSHVQGMYARNFTLTKNIALYIISCLKYLKQKKYDYAIKFQRGQVGESKIILPENKFNAIDYDFMEHYIDKIKTYNLNRIKIVKEKYDLNTKDSMKESIKIIKKFEQQKFKEYKIKELFYIKNNPSKDAGYFQFSDTNPYPYFTRKSEDNGIKGYVDYYDEEHKIEGNCIAVGLMQNIFFYISQDFYTGQFTKRLITKLYKLNAINAHFVVYQLNMFSKQLCDVLPTFFNEELEEKSIKLPIKDNKIDYEYIENYTKAIMELEINKVTTYV